MDSPRLRTLAALVICALASGCAARSVHSFLERGVDLGRYQSYGWGPADPAGTGDPRLDNNQIFEERVHAAVEQQLAARGFQKATSGSPQVLIHFHASVEQRIDLRDKELSTPCPDCKPFVYDAGTLLIDLVDARTNTLLWRGWSEGNAEGVVDSQRWLDRWVDQDVKRILEQLPRRAR